MSACADMIFASWLNCHRVYHIIDTHLFNLLTALQGKTIKRETHVQEGGCFTHDCCCTHGVALSALAQPLCASAMFSLLACIPLASLDILIVQTSSWQLRKQCALLCLYVRLSSSACSPVFVGVQHT